MLQNQANGVSTQGQRSFDPDIIGMAGELAVCKYFNRWPDLSIGPHYSGHDLMVKGKRVDVKTTKYNPGYLQAKMKKTVDACDVYILVHSDFPSFEILGGATSEQLINPSTIRDTGFGERYTLEQTQLSTLRSLFA